MPKSKTNQKFSKIARDFEKKNPAMVKAMKLMEMSMKEYRQAVEAMNPSKISIGNSTVVTQQL